MNNSQDYRLVLFTAFGFDLGTLTLKSLLLPLLLTWTALAAGYYFQGYLIFSLLAALLAFIGSYNLPKINNRMQHDLAIESQLNRLARLPLANSLCWFYLQLTNLVVIPTIIALLCLPLWFLFSGLEALLIVFASAVTYLALATLLYINLGLWRWLGIVVILPVGFFTGVMAFAGVIWPLGLMLLLVVMMQYLGLRRFTNMEVAA